MFTVKKIHNVVFSNCIKKNSQSNAGSQFCNTTNTTVTHRHHHLIGGASKEGLVTLSSGYHYRRSLKQRA